MAIARGNDGVVKITAATVARVKSFSVDMQMEPIESTDLATDDKTFVKGDRSWTAQVECQWDTADTAGQNAMITAYEAGTTVAFHGVRDGASDDVTGSAFIVNVGTSNTKGEMVAQTFSLQGTGALTGA
jgi:hypothetical protein